MFEHPWVLILIPIALIALQQIIKRNIVSYDKRYSDDQTAYKRQHRSRITLFFTRAAILTLLLIAIATPVLQTDIITQTDPRIDILVDESASMQLFEDAGMTDRLAERTRVREYVIATGNNSALGDAILSRLEEGGHVIVLSDGQTTSGPSLASVASYAASIDATINTVNLTRIQEDAGVLIDVDEVVLQDAQTRIGVDVHATDALPRSVTVLVDGKVIDERAAAQPYVLEHVFSQGTHTVTARIQSPDAFTINNEYTATLRAAPQPRILLVRQRTGGLETILNELYDTQVSSTIPDDLSPYAAVVLYDMPRSALRSDEAQLQEYLATGGGVFVVGGERSFEYGGYENTLLEAMLPVRIGAGANQRASGSIAVAIDLSGSTLGSVKFVDGEETQGSQQTQNVQKALAVDLIEQLNANNRVGALGFTYPQPNSKTCTGACVLSPIRPLGEHREEIIDNIARVDTTGGTALWVGVQGSMQMLEQTSGSQNIVLISDGMSGTDDYQRSLNAARTFNARGGKIYTVHVGNSQQGFSFMQDLAAAGGGVAFTADRNNRLAVLFGEPEDADEEDAYAIVPVDEYHFITQSIESTATLFGYNQVVPKTGAHQLLTSNTGQPVLTIWNYGIGRVAALTAFSGNDLGAMLQTPNSEYLSRTVNWAIGPLERVQENLIIAEDARRGEDIVVRARTSSNPSQAGVGFTRVDQGVYEATLEAQPIGVYDVLSTKYAINRPKEFDKTGVSQELIDAVALSGGRVYEQSDIDAIVDHARTLSEIKDLEQEPLRWPFILAALAIYLGEVIIRRINALRKRS